MHLTHQTLKIRISRQHMGQNVGQKWFDPWKNTWETLYFSGYHTFTSSGLLYPCQLETRAGVYETLCPQHMLTPEDNLETRCQSWKRGISQSNIHGNLPKVNQVIYTLDTICVPNIMILAQAVLQIFWWQGSIGLQSMSKKGHNSVKYLQNFMKS